MDRSFLAFRQFLQRIVSGTDHPRRGHKPAAHRLGGEQPRDEAKIPDDWARIEL